MNLMWHGIDRGSCWVSNVCQLWPGRGSDGKDLHPDEADLERDRPFVFRELEIVKPKVVIALGVFAAEWFLGPGPDIHTVNGIPHNARASLQKRFPGLTVVPVVHPAAGLHEPKSAAWTWLGIRAASEFLKGKVPVWRPKSVPDDFSEIQLIAKHEVDVPCAVDTEGTRFKPWCVSVSTQVGTYVVLAKNAHHLQFQSEVTFHNSQWDVPVLRALKVGLPVHSQWEDTMLMAHAFGESRIGLKALSYRHLGVLMDSFDKLVLPYVEAAAMEYVRDVVSRNWPKLPPSLIYDPKKKAWREYQPQAIDTRAWRVVSKEASALDWLEKLTRAERALLEPVLGPVPVVSLDLVPKKKAIQYAGLDAWATRELKPILMAHLERTGRVRAYRHDQYLVDALTEMETTGLPFNTEKAEALDVDFAIQEKAAAQTVVRFSGDRNFNPRSPLQVGEILTRLGATGRRRTASGAESSDEKTLEVLRVRRGTSPRLLAFLDAILDFRGWAKLRSTYTLKLPTYVRDGRIFPHLSSTTAISGRFSSEDPNLQNIPSRDEAGMKIRSCFEAPEGYVLLACDLSQIELRLGAHLSEDPTMIEVFKKGEDLHEKTRKFVFRNDPHLEDPAHEEALRKRAKTANFSVLYGITPNGLYQRFLQMGIRDFDEIQCAKLIREWFALYPRVRAYLDSVGKSAKRSGYAQTEGGRVRFLPLSRLVQYPGIEAEAIRQAGNHGIQGTASEILKRGIHRWSQSVRSACNALTETRLLLQIHDELLFLVKGTASSKRVLEVAVLVKAMMEADSDNYRVPILAEVKIGANWGEMRKVK